MSLKIFFPHLPGEKIADYESRKEQIRKSSVDGRADLLKELKGSESGSNKIQFLNRLCEFNFFYSLLARKQIFQYVKKDYDFLIGQFAISVKSLQPKKFEQDEEEKIEKMIKKAAEEKITQKDTLVYSYHNQPGIKSYVDIEMGPDGSRSRVETSSGPNSSLPSDNYERRVILSYLADFEAINLPQKKIIFFFRQARGAQNFLVEDVADWYFNLPPRFGDGFDYAGNFRGKTKAITMKQNNIKGIIFMEPPPDLLLWPSSAMNPENLKIWTETQVIKKDIENYFLAY